MLVDPHCHLGDAAFDEDRADVVARARAAGVGHVVIVAESAAATVRARTLAAQYGWSATAGVHPHEARHWDAAARATVEDALADSAVVAVGETGLDYHYDFSPRSEQRRAFADHLELGARFGRPVVVHAREADDDLAAMLRDAGRAAPAVILHSFSAGPAVLDAGLAIGAYFSFSGMISLRVILLAILPREGKLMDYRILRDMKTKLAFSDAEMKTLNLTETDGQVTWSGELPDLDLEIGQRAQELIVEALKKLDAEGKVDDQNFVLFEKFMPTGEEA